MKTPAKAKMYILVCKEKNVKITIEATNQKDCFDYLHNALQTTDLKGKPVGMIYLDDLITQQDYVKNSL